MSIKAADVAKLRKMTGAGMLDCKNALTDANGNFDEAIKIIREKGKAIASKRSDRDAAEGVILSKASADNTKGAIIALNCETDFVGKTDSFIQLGESILDLALAEAPADVDALKSLNLDGKSVADRLSEAVAAMGEKIDVSEYAKIEAAQVVAYIHPGNGLSSLVGLNEAVDVQVGKDVAMQIAAMAPVAVDKDGVAQNIIDRELEIGKEQARQDGKPEEMLEKIAMGKLNKFFKESTLLNQQFVKDNKKSVQQYLTEVKSGLTVTEFKRFALAE